MRLGLKADAVDPNAQASSKPGADRRDEQVELGPLGQHYRIDISYLIAARAEHRYHPGQKVDAGYASESRIAVGKMRADIAQAGRAPQSVTYGVGQHVGVRVAQKPLVESDIGS